MVTLTSDAHHRGERLDRFLAQQLPSLSRARLQELIRGGQVSVAGTPRRRPSERLHGQENVVIDLQERAAPALAAWSIPLEILYEDDALAVINKPAGMVVHPGAGTQGPTLVNALLHHFQTLSSLGSAGTAPRPGIVHRLDRMTSGLLIVAKTDAAHHALGRQFQRREVEKFYLTLVHGHVTPRQGTINAPIHRDLRHRTRMTTRRATGRTAHTAYTLLEYLPPAPDRGEDRPVRRWSQYSFLRVQIFTGRTHQIRVHLASLGHPVVGDRTYGAPASLTGPEPVVGVQLPRLFLHAEELRFRHPLSEQPLAFRAPLPADLAQLLETLRCRPVVPLKASMRPGEPL